MTTTTTMTEKSQVPRTIRYRPSKTWNLESNHTTPLTKNALTSPPSLPCLLTTCAHTPVCTYIPHRAPINSSCLSHYSISPDLISLLTDRYPVMHCIGRHRLFPGGSGLAETNHSGGHESKHCALSTECKTARCDEAWRSPGTSPRFCRRRFL